MLAAIVLLPVATEIGVHPIHFAAIVGTNLGLGNVSPPCAPMLYTAAGISKLSLDKYIVPTMKLLCLGPSAHGADRHLHPGPLADAAGTSYGNRMSGGVAP